MHVPVLASPASQQRIYYACVDLKDFYTESLRQMKTVEGSMQSQATAANRGWAYVVGKILGRLADPVVMEKLQLTGSFQRLGPNSESVDTFYQMIIEQASHWAWDESEKSETGPRNWSGILDSNPQLAFACAERLQEDCSVVQQAIQAYANHQQHGGVDAEIEA